ncbi:MAG: response regulator [Burkholderiaceae bacterium]
MYDFLEQRATPRPSTTKPGGHRDDEHHKAESSAQPRVLVVEDQPDIRKLLKFLLETRGMQVATVGDGRSATEMIDTWPAPDLILMDRMLPYVSGDDLIRQVRADETWGKVPIVVVSAKARSEEIQESMHDGADDYLTKPVKPARLLEMVHRYV